MEKSSKVDVFSASFGLKLEDEGAKSSIKNKTMKIMYLKWIDIDEKAVVCFFILANRSISGKTNVCLLGSYSFCYQFGFLTRSCSGFRHFVKKWRTFFRISWIWPDAEDLSNSALSVLFSKMAATIASKWPDVFKNSWWVTVK